MAIFRVHKNNDYTMINNYLIKDKNLKLKDKGMLLVLLSLPDKWNFSVSGLEKICKESKDTINGILNNLEKYEYLERSQERDNKGRFIDWKYDIYEIPKCLYDNLPHPKKPDMDNRDIENPDMENYTQLNTNKLKTNKENIKIKYFDDEELNDLFNEFLDLRIKLKAKNTDRAITLLLNELNKWDKETKMKMLNNSIMSSWKSVYPLKKSKSTSIEPEWLDKEIKPKVNKEAEEFERRFFEELEKEQKN